MTRSKGIKRKKMESLISTENLNPEIKQENPDEKKKEVDEYKRQTEQYSNVCLSSRRN